MDENIKNKILEFAAKANRYFTFGYSDIIYESTISNFAQFLIENNLFEKNNNLAIPVCFIEKFFEDESELEKFKKDAFSARGSRENYKIKVDIESETILDPEDIPNLNSLVIDFNKEETEEYSGVFWEKVKEANELDGEYPSDFSTGYFYSYYSEFELIDAKYAGEIYLDICREYIEEKFDTEKEEIVNSLRFDIEKQFKLYGKDMALAIKNSDDNNLKKDIAISYYASDDDSLSDNVIDTMGELFKLINKTTEGSKPELILSIPKEIIKLWGIKSGRFYENAPWDLFRLGPQHLFLEGRIMKHCVGTYSEYAKAIIEGEAEIWSLRSREGNPQFTFEIDGIWNNMNNELREKSIRQIKGKGNRLPGFASKSAEEITLEDEVIFLFCLFRDMGISLKKVSDISPQIQYLGLS